MIIINTQDFRKDFFQMYPEFLAFKEFAELYEKDKKNASIIMWGIILYAYPHSPMYHANDKKERVNDFLKKAKADLDTISTFISLFEDVCLTEYEKSYNAWNEAMRQRREWLRTQEYTDNQEMNKALDDMHSKTAKMYADLEKIYKQIKQDKQSRDAESGKKSASELGEI